jgi:alkylation response protein AidB-like acyl-CoA dehydrogenase
MPLFRKLATLATAAEAARRYAKKNPDKASKYVDQAAQFIDKQTKGKYSGQITGAASKAKSVAGIKPNPGYGPAGNGYPTQP